MRMGFLGPRPGWLAPSASERSQAVGEPQDGSVRPGEEVVAEWVELASAGGSDALTTEQLLATVAACRSKVAEALHQTSKDYRVLCSLAQSDIAACESITAELRRRLASNSHYAVLCELDDAFAIARMANERNRSE